MSSMESYRLHILFQNFSSVLKLSQMAVKELMIKHISGNTASRMMDYWGLEIDRHSWTWGVKWNSHIFLHTGIEVLNLNYKILLTKSSAHIPWILREKRRATNTSSQRPQLIKAHTAFPWGETGWASDSIAFLSSAKDVPEIWFSAPKYLAACAKLLTLQ